MTENIRKQRTNNTTVQTSKSLGIFPGRSLYCMASLLEKADSCVVSAKILMLYSTDLADLLRPIARQYCSLSTRTQRK